MDWGIVATGKEFCVVLAGVLGNLETAASIAALMTLIPTLIPAASRAGREDLRASAAFSAPDFVG